MSKVKLTKGELKKQKDQLKRFQRYLPTLLLKKQLLQMEIRQVELQIEEKQMKRQVAYNGLLDWVAVFGEGINISELIIVSDVSLGLTNIAGVEISIYQEVVFEQVDYDLMSYPLWVDVAVKELQRLVAFDIELAFLEEQAGLLTAELKVTSQRVNLFEKVKIPEAKENIRVINIFLGDQQTAAVVRGKMSKSKLIRETI